MIHYKGNYYKTRNTSEGTVSQIELLDEMVKNTGDYYYQIGKFPQGSDEDTIDTTIVFYLSKEEFELPYDEIIALIQDGNTSFNINKTKK